MSDIDLTSGFDNVAESNVHRPSGWEDGWEQDGAERPASPWSVVLIAATLLGCAVWFLYSWRTLGASLPTAVGESAGSLAGVLLAISLVATVRRS